MEERRSASLGIFEQAKMALTCWVKGGPIFILIRMARA